MNAKDVVVAAIGESRGPKDDTRDAYELAADLRTGAIKRSVVKDVGQYKKLRELSRAQRMIVRDVVRIQNRRKSLYRSRGIAVSRQSAYSESGRQEALRRLPEAVRGAATMVYAQYDAVEPICRQAEKALVAESHRHPISRVLETCPGLGPIRSARSSSCADTPRPKIGFTLAQYLETGMIRG